MSKLEKWTQCKLHTNLPEIRLKTLGFESTNEMVCWLPSKQAVVGKLLRDEETNRIWKVVEVYQTVERKPDSHAAIKKHRKRTGDSEPY